jgi:hypothetical protein
MSGTVVLVIRRHWLCASTLTPQQWAVCIVHEEALTLAQSVYQGPGTSGLDGRGSLRGVSSPQRPDRL